MIISKDCFFIAGVTRLMESFLDNCVIVDASCTNPTDIAILSYSSDVFYIFVSNDIDYLAFRQFKGCVILDKRWNIEYIQYVIAQKNSFSFYKSKISFTKRECDIFKYLISGYSMRNASFHMGVKLKTCYAYRSELMRKLNINNRLAFYNVISKYF